MVRVRRFAVTPSLTPRTSTLCSVLRLRADFFVDSDRCCIDVCDAVVVVCEKPALTSALNPAALYDAEPSTCQLLVLEADCTVFSASLSIVVLSVDTSSSADSTRLCSSTLRCELWNSKTSCSPG